ncbi:MAG: albusnodin/ikarugamycin family macrolactam cyclase [Pseudonocardiaceae bacterium]
MGCLTWFGGLITKAGETPCAPSGSRLMAPEPFPLWTTGPWPDDEVRTAVAGHRQVAIFGPCSATGHEVRWLAERGVTDAVLLRFAGSYTVVESTPAGMTVFTDIGHAWPIYTAETRLGTVWGSNALALAALTNAQPDPSWLAAALLVPQAPELTAGRSAFTGITAVPPGSRLVLTSSAPLRVLSVWRPGSAAAEVTEGAAELRRALGDAVATRIAVSHSPSADCSDGLDSTSLTLLAADQLRAKSHLHAVTVHPVGITAGGDLDYARCAVRASPSIMHLLCPLDERHAPFSRIQELMPPTDEPAPTTITVARAVAEYELLRQVGSDCHLTGDGGDTLLGGHPTYLADLVRLHQIGLFAHHVIGWARLRRIPVWPVLGETLRTITTSFAASLMALALDLSSPAHRPQRGPGFTMQYPRSSPGAWATPRAREMAAEAASRAAVRVSDSGDAGTSLTRTLQAIQTVGRTARADLQVAERYGVRLHNPFTDPQVIAACLSVPAWQRHTPYQYKPLLTAALADLFPAEIAARRTKGDFTPDHYLGLRANASALHELADGYLASLDLVNPVRLRQLLAHAEAGLPVTSSDFEPALAAEIWLRAVTAAEPTARWDRSGAAMRAVP